MKNDRTLCVEVREQLSELLDGELAPERRQVALGHLGACADCARERRELERTVSLVRGLPREAAPAGLRAAVLGELQRARPSVSARSWARRWGPWLGGLAAAASLVVLAQMDFVTRMYSREEAQVRLAAASPVDVPVARARLDAPRAARPAQDPAAPPVRDQSVEPALLVLALEAADPELERGRIEQWLAARRARGEEAELGPVRAPALADDPSASAVGHGELAEKRDAGIDLDRRPGDVGDVGGGAASGAASPPAPPAAEALRERSARKHEGKDALAAKAAGADEAAAAPGATEAAGDEAVVELELTAEEYRALLAEFEPDAFIAGEGRALARTADPLAEPKPLPEAPRATVRLRIVIRKR